MGKVAPRLSPSQQAKMREHSKDEVMTRADSLKSMAQYGRIVPPSEQRRLAAKPKGFNLISKLKGALGGK